MVKSKRNKVVHLTQVKKKGKDHKEQHIDRTAKLLSIYQRVFVLNIHAVKSKEMMELRNALKPHARVFAGKNTLAIKAIHQHAKQSKTRMNFGQLEEHLKGKNALIFTDKSVGEITDLFEAQSPELKPRLIGHADLTSTTPVVFEKM